MARTYYDILGVSKEASKDEIKSAFRKKARQYHPDVNRDNEAEAAEKFKEVNEAYEVLSDETKRAQYDQYGHETFTAGGGASAHGFQGNPFGGDFGGFGGFQGGFEDIFSSFFGGGRTSHGPVAGDDLRVDIELSFEEAVFGAEKEISVRRREECKHCHGSGAEPGTKVETCPTCGGSGQRQVVHNTPLGRMATMETCPTCHGRGKRIEKPCSVCRGSGETKEKRTIKVQIPAGVDQGARIRVAGEGEPGQRGGPRGDIYVYLHVRRHRDFVREGQDIIVEETLSYTQAALGCTLKVKTLDGEASLRIPAGTQTGTTFRMRGKGVPFLRDKNRRGDQHVIVRVETPKKLSKNAQKLLLELARECGEDTEGLDIHSSLLDTITSGFSKAVHRIQNWMHRQSISLQSNSCTPSKECP